MKSTIEKKANKQMDWQLPGKLENSGERLSFAGCRVEAFFDQVFPAEKPVKESPTGKPAKGSPTKKNGVSNDRRSGKGTEAPLNEDPATAAEMPTPTAESMTPSRVSALSDESGKFTLVLPDRDEITSKKLNFIVSAPSGQTIAETELVVDRIKDLVSIDVRKFGHIVLDKPDRPVERLTRRILGRVIERNGRPLPAGLQVLLFARGADRTKNGKKEDELLPVFATKVDGTGYFSGEVPNTEFIEAAAVVAGVPGEIPIRLEESFLPQKIVLVIELPETPAGPVQKDCACVATVPPRTPSQTDIAEAPDAFSVDLGTGQCVQFSKPNRAIEEFDFYSVVRTTEPDIRGITVGPVSEKPVRQAAVLPPPPPGDALPPPPPGRRVQPPPGVAVALQPYPDAAILRPRFSLTTLGGEEHPPGRVQLDRRSPIDWDLTPTFYEAATIAHGHLLHFKQVWYADGYSMGDLLYSLPLAPGQKKLISVVDWERREQTTREEVTSASEGLNAALSRDRDLSEVVTGALSESARGGSRSTSTGVGVGTGTAMNGSYQGFNFGALTGVSGGYGDSNSSAWQDSARNLTSTSLQNLRDKTLQSASAVRGLRSTLVQTARQGEAVRATTEVVANHNHCHALTIQYFEVLRHLKVTHELVDVQECLFVPLPMSEFDRPKALRWRQPLETYLQRRELTPAFDAARRVETLWSDVDTPAARYADELVTAIFGELKLTILIPLPPFPEKPKPKPEETAAETAAAVSNALNPTTGFLGVVLGIASGGASLLAGAATNAAIDAAKATAQGARALAESLLNEPSPEERYARFQREVMPGAAAGFVDRLEIYALVGANEVKLNGADFTLVTDYQPGVPLTASVRGRVTNSVSRANISALIIKSSVPLPPGCRAIVNTASLRYQTKLFQHDLVDDQRVNDDIDLPIVAHSDTPPLDPFGIPLPPVPLPGFPPAFSVPGMVPVSTGNGATLYTPPDAWEQKSPRKEDIRLATELVEHLNDNLEYYHNAVWWTMDPNRRYMLLDGYYAPNSKDRSIASVVENRLIGIVGNSLILPVARGVHLDPRFANAKGEATNLLEFYALSSPSPPSRVSLPTRGVFAEAVMGNCNACEQIDDTRFWRWEDSPIDEPPALDAAAIASRRSEPSYGQPTPFPTPIVSIQNAPSVPDPAGVRSALDAITKQSFADITGLAGTQANAAAAYSKALDTALQFGKEASTLAQAAGMNKNIGQTMGAIDKAQAEGKIDEGDAKQLRTAALKKMVGDASTDAKASSVTDRLKVIEDQVAKGTITKGQGAEQAEQIMKGLDSEDAPLQDEQRAATEAIRKIPGESVTSIATKDPSGAETTINANPNFAPIASGRDIELTYQWSDLIAFALKQSLQDELQARGLNWQRLNKASSANINLDRYLIEILRLPDDPKTGRQLTDDAFFAYVRRNFGKFSMQYRLMPGATFEEYEAADKAKWSTNDPVGAVMKFSVMGLGVVPEFMLVQCAEHVMDVPVSKTAVRDWHWNFVTVGAPGVIGNHPVSGTRRFGLRRIGNEKSRIFFSEGADRASGIADAFLSETLFTGGDEFWRGIFANIVAFINANQGEATLAHVSSHRYAWLRVRQYLELNGLRVDPPEGA